MKFTPIHGDASNMFIAPEYKSWSCMITRCTLPSHAQFKDYGGRGVKVCSRWRNNYVDFLEDMGRKPTPNHTLGRINNEGNYEPGNVEWQTRIEQARNRSSNKLTLAKARRIRWLWNGGYSYRELARKFNVSIFTIYACIKNKIWKEEEVTSR